MVEEAAPACPAELVVLGIARAGLPVDPGLEAGHLSERKGRSSELFLVDQARFDFARLEGGKLRQPTTATM